MSAISTLGTVGVGAVMGEGGRGMIYLLVAVSLVTGSIREIKDWFRYRLLGLADRVRCHPECDPWVPCHCAFC